MRIQTQGSGGLGRARMLAYVWRLLYNAWVLHEERRGAAPRLDVDRTARIRESFLAVGQALVSMPSSELPG